jgi:hypothetical protein
VVYTRRALSEAVPGAEEPLLQRIVLIVIVLVGVWRITIAIGRRRRETGFGADSYSRFSPLRRRRRRELSARLGDERADHLVACRRCGTYVPSRRALTSGSGEVFCGPGCRDQVQATDAHDA